MSHYFRIFSISTIFLFLINGILMQSVADPASPVLFTEEEQKFHLEKMKNMSEEEKQRYRTEQYQILRNKAAAIGYDMPDTPPWANANAADANAPTPTDRMHKEQLDKYRLEATEKRQAMHKRLEQQRQTIKKRIADLVDRHAVKPSVEPQAPVKPYSPKPIAPAQPYQPGFQSGYQPGYQPGYPPAHAYPPAPPMNTLGRNYPGFYRVPPPPVYNYPY